MIKVLLTDTLFRKSFDLFNILNRYKNKYKILICSSNKNIFTYLINIIIYWKVPYQLRTDNYNNFQKDLNGILKSNTYNEIVYIPIEEMTTLLFYEFIQNNSYSNLKYKLPPRPSYNITHDKYLLMKFCEKEKFPHPVTYDSEKVDTLNLNISQIIIKPRVGSGSENIKHIKTQEDLKILNNINLEQVIVQEKIGGQEVIGAFYLFDRENLISSYCHQRIRTFPELGGVTVYSKLIKNDEVILLGEKLLRLLNWDGMAMVEFLFDPDDKKYKVIEINPRLWGSILLSEFSNINIIENYIELSLNQQPKNYQKKVNSAIRWLFPFEIINLIKNKFYVEGFWKFDLANTCYIGFTYSNKLRSILFIILSSFRFEQIIKNLKKIIR